MPRRIELTFQKGSKGRAGRWKKQYKGETHYLGSGSSKSDLKSYRQALSKWEEKKEAIDSASAKPHDQEYDEAIEKWELALSWAVQHGDEDFATDARNHLAELRKCRDLQKQPPISFRDRLESCYRIDPKTIEDVTAIAAKVPTLSDLDLKQLLIDSVGRPECGLTEKRKASGALDRPRGASPAPELEFTKSFQHPRGVDPVTEMEIRWRDRLENQQTMESASEDERLGTWITLFLDNKRKCITVGRYTSLEKTLNSFRDWCGPQTSVHSITARVMTRFRTEQLELIENGTYSNSYMRDRMSAAKSFVRWLWEQEVIEHLPRNLDSRELQIVRQVTTPEVFDINEIKQLFKSATGKTKLYILLALNTGMTQKDIANLRDDELNWKDGRLTRKRGKTKRFESVPTVTYKLWPEVLELLVKFRSGSDRVLLNSKGDPLHQEYIGDTGKHKKNDNIKNAYERVKRKLSLKKSFGKLRKTSATLIEAEPLYRGLDELFLGHAPSSIAKRHYVATSDHALDEAIDFLRSKYEIDNTGVAGEQSTKKETPQEAAETSAA